MGLGAKPLTLLSSVRTGMKFAHQNQKRLRKRAQTSNLSGTRGAEGKEMKSNMLGLIAVGLTIGPLAAQATSIAGTWSGVGVPDPTSVQAPYDQLATLVISSPVPSDGLGDLSFAATVDVTCIHDALYALNPDPKCGSGGDKPFTGTLSPTGELTTAFGGSSGLGSYLGGNTFVIDIAYSDSTAASPDIEDWTFTRASVPEPATLALLGLGLAGIGFMRKRQTN